MQFGTASQRSACSSITRPGLVRAKVCSVSSITRTDAYGAGPSLDKEGWTDECTAMTSHGKLAADAACCGDFYKGNCTISDASGSLGTFYGISEDVYYTSNLSDYDPLVYTVDPVLTVSTSTC